MSWLIEAYLDEGKHGPDHPKSLKMDSKYDYRWKKRAEQAKKEDDDFNAKRRDRTQNKTMEKDRRRFSIDDGEYDKLTAAIAVNKKAYERPDLKHVTGDEAQRARAIDATYRHNRRHPEARLESGWLVEAFYNEAEKNIEVSKMNQAEIPKVLDDIIKKKAEKTPAINIDDFEKEYEERMKNKADAK